MDVRIKNKTYADWDSSFVVKVYYDEILVESDFAFDKFDYRIAGEIFSRWSEHMNQVIKKTQLWDRLRHEHN